jgi:hypothetical protein
LRAAVAAGERAAAAEAAEQVVKFFAWAERAERAEARRHFASARAAEAFACLVAARSPALAALAARLCAPYLRALADEYGTADPHNAAMRAHCAQTCWRCGAPAASRCARCQQASYCGGACQRADWAAEHRRACAAAVGERRAES